jgi:two-component system, OmpR family, response regulator MprA
MDRVNVLVVDDDTTVRDSIDRALRVNGFDVTLAGDGREALDQMACAPFDAVILDVLMPGVDGLAVCRSLRGTGNSVPILMLTARDAVPDRVTGLEAGADDYLVKPFALEELLARLRALLRRTMPAVGDRVLRFADVTLDAGSFEVHRGGRKVDLRRMEFLLLELFLLNPRQLLSRTTIYERVWGYDFGPSSNSLDVQLGQLRQRLEAGGEARLIHTIRGMGFILRES